VIRIPVAWDIHANQSNYQIDARGWAASNRWVDWAYARNLTIIINIHWDGGWLENNIGDSVNPTINAKIAVLLGRRSRTPSRTTTIAFSSPAANEPKLRYRRGVVDSTELLQHLHQRRPRTGGLNNTSRWLIVQGPNTNIDLSDQLVTSLPNDSTSGRLAFEVHWYEPYQWSSMGADADWGKMWYFWGQGYHHPTRTDRNPTYGEESYVDSEFQKMVTKFVSKGVPVIIGEFQAIKRSGYSDLTGSDYDLHVAARTYWHRYVVNAANSRGIRPIYWDIAGQMFNWNTGATVDADTKRVLTGGAALPPPGGGIIANGTYRIVARHSGKALDVSGGGTADGSNVIQWTYGGGTNQRWTVTHLGNNQYSIIGVQSGKALEVSNWGTANGSNVQIWTNGGGTNQKWTISATSGGYYRLTPNTCH
jgi:hypothetical protein